MISRRQFIQRVGLLGGILLTPLGRLARRYSQEPTEEEPQPEGEIYAGFVLLPEGAAVPDFVRKAPIPIFGGIEGDSQNEVMFLDAVGITESFSSIADVSKVITFPLFVFESAPRGMNFLQGYVDRFEASLKVWAVNLFYGYKNDEIPRMSLYAIPRFPKPFPVWPVTKFPIKNSDEVILEDEFMVVYPQKIDYTPPT